MSEQIIKITRAQTFARFPRESVCRIGSHHRRRESRPHNRTRSASHGCAISLTVNVGTSNDGAYGWDEFANPLSSDATGARYHSSTGFASAGTGPWSQVKSGLPAVFGRHGLGRDRAINRSVIAFIKPHKSKMAYPSVIFQEGQRRFRPPPTNNDHISGLLFYTNGTLPTGFGTTSTATRCKALYSADDAIAAGIDQRLFRRNSGPQRHTRSAIGPRVIFELKIADIAEGNRRSSHHFVGGLFPRKPLTQLSRYWLRTSP